MNDITFVNIYDHLQKKFFEPPVGLVSLCEVLKKSEKNGNIIDFQYLYYKNMFNYDENFAEYVYSMRSYILETHPRIISFYTMCNNLHIILEVAKIIKQINSHIIIGLGGPQATLTAKAIMEENDFLDFIGIGEGENTIVNIVNKMSTDFKDSTEKIRGLIYRNHNGMLVSGEMPDLIENMDDLPILNYSEFEISNLQNLPLDVGRGCPFQCSFCSTKNFWKRKYRLKSPERLVNEILYYKNNFNITNFSLLHDMFTADRRQVLLFCDLLEKKRTGVNWTCSARIDCLDTELISKMMQAGCVGIFIGIESGSENVQKLIRKNLDLPNAFEKINSFIKMGMHMVISFMYGFPRETENDLNDTLEYIYNIVEKNHDLEKHIQLHKLSFFAGTELTEKYLNELIYDESINNTMCFENNIKGTGKFSKKVFPHFYNYPSELRCEFSDLDKFVVFILLKTIKSFNSTYKALNTQKLKLTELYRLFVHYNEDHHVIEKLNFFNTEFTVPVEKIKVMKEFYDLIMWSDFSTYIKEICEAEYFIVLFQYDKNQREAEKQIGFDFIRYRHEGLFIHKNFSLHLHRIANGGICLKQLLI